VDAGVYTGKAASRILALRQIANALIHPNLRILAVLPPSRKKLDFGLLPNWRRPDRNAIDRFIAP
jgi:hypothetical protein